MVIFGEVPVWSQLGGPFGMLCGRVLPFVGGLTLEWFFLGCFVAG